MTELCSGSALYASTNGNAIIRLGRRAVDVAIRDRPALYASDSMLTHGGLHALAARTAVVLADRGVGIGSRVLLAAPDGIGWVATFLAIGRLGAVAVLVNPQLAVPEHEAIVAVSRPELVIADDQLPGLGPATATAELAAAARRAPEHPGAGIDGAAPLYVQFTSGTTGAPKGALHRHADLVRHHRAVGVDVLHITAVDVTLSMSKLYFAYGFGNSVIYPLHSGSAAVLLPGRPTAEVVGEAADRHGVTVLHAVPSGLAHLTAEADAAAFGSVRVAVSAGERLPLALGARAHELLGAPVLDELGSTEVGGAFCANRIDDNVPGTVGRPLRGFRIRVDDGTGRPVPPDTEGRLRVSGPTLLAGYVDRPGEDVLRDGWLDTHDTGVLRSDGRLVHTGRSDDIELVGGMNVAPGEIEELLAAHPAVGEAVPDERGATRLRAFVVLAESVIDGATDRHGLARELLGTVRARLAPYKVPRSVTFVASLPRTPTGKLRRHAVRAGQW